MKRFLLLMSFLGFAGCATHSLMRGSVVMKVSDTDAHVCLGDKEVQVGDHVELYKNVCKGGLGSGKDRIEQKKCEKVEFGHGEVAEVLNEHYSVVKFPPGTKFSEGDTIEKHQH